MGYPCWRVAWSGLDGEDVRTVSFVTTANAMVGMGHLRRCLTLSDELYAHDVRTEYFLYAADASVQEWMRGRVPEVQITAASGLSDALHRAAGTPVVVVDTYDIGGAELWALRQRGCSVLLIDDLADREMPATWVLNSCVEDPAVFAGLTEAQLLLGPSYALLRPQFRTLPNRIARQSVAHVLLTFGGSDVMGLTVRMLSVLESYPTPLHIRAVVGLLARPFKVSHPRHHVEMLQNADNMAELMTWADMAIATAGQTIFELAAAGCPALCLQVVDNQRHNAGLFASRGAATVRDARTTDDGELAEIICAMSSDVVRRQTMGRAGQAAVDGWGAARVVAVL